MNKMLLKIVIIVSLLFIFLPSNIIAIEKNIDRTVTVGVYDANNTSKRDIDGELDGYMYDVIHTMKRYVNWKFKYVGFNMGWGDVEKMILDGNEDMISFVVKTPERLKEFDFSDRAISQSGVCLFVRSDESKYIGGNYKTYNGMRIGIANKTSHIDSIKQFAKEKGFSFEPVFFDNGIDLNNAIFSGEIDAIVTSSMYLTKGLRQLEIFDMKDVFVVVKKGNTQLLDEINFALEQISLHNPNLYELLRKKYYSITEDTNVYFTSDEYAFIDECKKNDTVFKCAIVPSMSPYSYFEDGKPNGFMYEIARDIMDKTSVKYEILVIEDEYEYRKNVENNNIDIRLMAYNNNHTAEKLGYTITSPYFETSVSRITRNDFSGNIKTVGMQKNSSIEVYYNSELKNGEKIIEYDTIKECVDAVLNRECDAFYIYTYSAHEAVYLDETNRLTSLIMPSFKAQFTIGVRENIDTRLVSILEKICVSVSEDEIARKILKFTNYEVKGYSYIRLLYNYPIVFVTIVIAFLIFVFVSILCFYIEKKRTIEINRNHQLEKALLAAEEANSAKSIFMSRMSHEIRTPLNAIIGYNNISYSSMTSIQDDSDYKKVSSKVIDCLMKTSIASGHLLSVINDVLDMSAIESGKIKICRESFDFRNLISSLTILFYSQAKENSIDYEVLFNSEVDEYYIGDEMRLRQILTNILSNAVKFTPKGGKILFEISQTKTNDEMIMLNLKISDTGIGMSEEFIQKLWNPFEQADSSISRRFGGTGLGLSITKNLIELMGGSIKVTSKENIGSCFDMNIPLKMSDKKFDVYDYDFGKTNILVVDDEENTCEYLVMLLKRYGAKAEYVTSGQDAIMAIEKQKDSTDYYNVCIVDWKMPKMNGIETIKKIREIAKDKIMIIVASAYDYSEIVNEAQELGVNSFLAKPLFQSTVFDMLMKITEKKITIVSEENTNYDFKGAKVLFAEDNIMNMEIANSILRLWNISVDNAVNGEEAVKMFCASKEGTYKAILMDIHMPVLDGYNATKQIRALSREDAKDVPIIAMTADVFAEDVAEAMNAGMNAHIGKPIDTQNLLTVIKKYLDQ